MNMNKTKYMVYVFDSNNDIEVQTVLDYYDDCIFYAKENVKAGTQYIAKFTTMDKEDI